MNGKNLINELRKLTEEEKVDPVDGMKILWASSADILENQHELRDEQEKVKTEQRELRAEIGLKINKIDERVKKNLAFKFGDLIQKNPKASFTTAITMFGLWNVWFIGGLRKPLLQLLVPLGFPQEWVEFLSP